MYLQLVAFATFVELCPHTNRYPKRFRDVHFGNFYISGYRSDNPNKPVCFDMFVFSRVIKSLFFLFFVVAFNVSNRMFIRLFYFLFRKSVLQLLLLWVQVYGHWEHCKHKTLFVLTSVGMSCSRKLLNSSIT